MDAIKKKMQAMKIEKDNAMDRADQCEQAAKVAKVEREQTNRKKHTMFDTISLKLSRLQRKRRTNEQLTSRK